MIAFYIGLYMCVGIFLLILMTLSGKANWLKVPTFELKFTVGLIFILFWIILAPVMYFNQMNTKRKHDTKTSTN
jgi:hypothetical protein